MLALTLLQRNSIKRGAVNKDFLSNKKKQTKLEHQKDAVSSKCDIPR